MGAWCCLDALAAGLQSWGEKRSKRCHCAACTEDLALSMSLGCKLGVLVLASPHGGAGAAQDAR